jgi:hypothetical protein
MAISASRRTGRSRSKRPVWTLSDYARFAKVRGGKLLTKGRKSAVPRSDALLTFRCSSGHEWSTRATATKCQHRWCFRCARSRSKAWSLKDFRSHAKRNGGTLVDRRPDSLVPLSKDCLAFRCLQGHEWTVQAHAIKRFESWCRVCSRSRDPWTKERFARYAADRGGELISTHGHDAIEHLERVRFRCSHEHVWDTYAGTVIQKGTWCLQCHADSRRKPFDDLIAIAAERGGEFVSPGKNRNHKATWRCARGHTFRAVPWAVKSGCWCGECTGSLCERIVRSHFEQLFGKPFPRVRPDWLRNTTGQPLELDGYNESLSMAFEHQGGQHYRHVHHFRGMNRDRIAARDKRKRRLCRERGVRLIVVPELMKQLQVKDLKAFILKECDSRGIKVASRRRSAEIRLGNLYSVTREDELLERLRDICKARGGECLAQQYLGATAPLPFRCAERHEWTIRPQDVFAGSWCQKCAVAAVGRDRRLSIEAMQELAGSRNGHCLSTEYVNAHHKLRWRCGDCLHEWSATPSSVMRGSWCPECASSRGWRKRRDAHGANGFSGRPGPAPKYTIADMRKLATTRGGKCLSEAYVNAHTPLQWMCGICDHKWMAAPSDVRQGTWCPRCAASSRRKARVR